MGQDARGRNRGELETHPGRAAARIDRPAARENGHAQDPLRRRRAAYAGSHRIRLTFADGVQKTIDFLRWLTGPVFEPLKDGKYLQRLFLDGWTIAWPNGAGVAPETLYAAAAVPDGRPNKRIQPARVAGSAKLDGHVARG
jgi:hypothetical protein